jgi:hypothetical protein
MIAAINQAGHANTVAVVGVKAQPAAAADVETELKAVFPGVPVVEHFPLGNEQAFKETLKRAITRTRMALIDADGAAKVIAPEIRDEAVSNGIPVDTLSTLPSPGAGS